MNYIYIYNIKPELAILGDDHGELFLKGRENFYDITHLDYSRNLLPLLETDKSEFMESLSMYFSLDKDLMDKVLTRLIKFPFKNRMEYWANLSLDWMDSDIFNDLQWLNDLDKSWMSQSLKHKLFKISIRLKR